MKAYVIFIFIPFFFSCSLTNENNANDKALLNELRKETDSLKNEISRLKKEDKVKEATSDTLLSLRRAKATDTLIITKKSVIVKKKVHSVPDIKKNRTDTIYHFYTNSKNVSVKTDPLNDHRGKRKIRFYDPQGKITFEQEDVFSTYSVSTEIREFHANGAVKSIMIHFNPDASMHWYETIITFDTDNTPLWKEEITYPLTLESMMDNKFYWDKNKKQWIKQELVKEQPVQK